MRLTKCMRLCFQSPQLALLYSICRLAKTFIPPFRPLFVMRRFILFVWTLWSASFCRVCIDLFRFVFTEMSRDIVNWKMLPSLTRSLFQTLQSNIRSDYNVTYIFFLNWIKSIKIMVFSQASPKDKASPQQQQSSPWNSSGPQKEMC